MTLSDFIDSRMETILQGWEDYARSAELALPDLDSAGLRAHCEIILHAVAASMRKAAPGHHLDVSRPLPPLNGGSEMPDHSQGMTMLFPGLSMDQLMSLYKGLRWSVVSLWLEDEAFDPGHAQDILRFNAAIDQMLLESAAAYDKALQATRHTVLAMLGHDLRSPLSAVLMAGELLQQQRGLDDKGRRLATQVCSSARRASNLVNDLLDLARCNLRAGIAVHREPLELNALCRSIIEEIRVGYPRARIVLHEKGVATGRYDPVRMAQVFSNLIGNAICHGDASLPIHVTLSRQPGSVQFSVHNQGEPIPAEAMPHLFEPQGRYSSYARREEGPCAGLGLGLFIAGEIVAGHGGRIEVHSSRQRGTLFKVSLPGSDDSDG
ncbi:signal transduction histidine kinase [Pseudomonas sp. JAI115]|uniref:sensor histidine kinase n=1 Tax=Pseudomonas sp. JAI115 TaxID=2723061 RepID=UPI00161990CF|nr:HAMP domain-containing sensor histidine kinase [Pseudomonas sp. JAI115]MBB6155190.1 signal transduction histidine kinase [Pseudomonas sp. JAI115]